MHRRILMVMMVISAALWLGTSVAGKDKEPQQKSKTTTKDAKGNAKSSAAAFHALAVTLRHPRCMNCHSKGDFPRQGDDGHQHIMNVRRGPKGMGVTSQKCSTCHQEENIAGKNMPPGAPNWHLPPPNMPMIWQGLSNGEICMQLKDSARNGHKTVAEIVKHMAEDKLVLWGWNPGDGRNPVPMPHAEFAKLAVAWEAGGAVCPK